MACNCKRDLENTNRYIAQQSRSTSELNFSIPSAIAFGCLFMVNKVATSLTIFYLPRGSGALDSKALNFVFLVFNERTIR